MTKRITITGQANVPSPPPHRSCTQFLFLFLIWLTCIVLKAVMLIYCLPTWSLKKNTDSEPEQKQVQLLEWPNLWTTSKHKWFLLYKCPYISWLISKHYRTLVLCIAISYLYEKNDSTPSPCLTPQPYAPPFSLKHKDSNNQHRIIICIIIGIFSWWF